MNNSVDINKGFAYFEGKKINIMHDKKSGSIYLCFDDLCKMFKHDECLNMKDIKISKFNGCKRFISFELSTSIQNSKFNSWLFKVFLKEVNKYNNKTDLKQIKLLRKKFNNLKDNMSDSSDELDKLNKIENKLIELEKYYNN